MTPETPRHSLPSYDEPTPETRGKFSREEEAERALKQTEFAAGTREILIALFLLTIGSVATIQSFHQRSWPTLKIFRGLPTAAEIKAAEKELESDSIVSQWLLPPVQAALTGQLRAGNEQAYVGRDGWLFYRPDVDYVTGPPFLAPAQWQRRVHAARVQPDPVRAIVQFHDQLAARGIELIIFPAPVKPSIDGEKLSARVTAGTELQNASFADFKARLLAANVRVFDPAPLLLQRKIADKNAPAYLETDTHWRPETMAFVAEQLAAALPNERMNGDSKLKRSAEEISGRGDIERMLRLPADAPLYQPERVHLQQISRGDGWWRATPDSDVLFLGDSFANIFSLDGLAWGESAGLVEHLSYSLGGKPLDCILRNSDGAFATRELLAHELARGRDRLAGKKLVIWEFAARELAFGNWKLLDLKLGQAVVSRYFSPAPGKTVEITGTVENVSLVPRPATVPYKDHIMTVQLADVKIAGHAPTESWQAIVYLASMRDNVWTPAARLRPGDRVSLRLRAWTDVATQYEQINRSEIDNPALQLEEPAWGELLN